MKTTYENVSLFLNVAQSWLSRDREHRNTKMGYAIMRISIRANKLMDRFREKRDDLDIDFCATDDNGIVRRNAQGELEYTKEDLKARDQARRKLFRSEVEIEPYYATELPSDLTPIEAEAFSGFVIREEEAEATSA